MQASSGVRIQIVDANFLINQEKNSTPMYLISHGKDYNNLIMMQMIARPSY